MFQARNRSWLAQENVAHSLRTEFAMNYFLEDHAPFVVAERQAEFVALDETISTARAILIIDDDPDILDVLAWTLEEAGYPVATVTSGREALQWIQAAAAVGEAPALILLDLAMPGMSGPQVMAALRQRWGTEISPIIVMSASQSANLHGRELGAAFTLTKPFDVKKLLKLVKQFAV
jgi:CheY-like chemotaxis protein